jgi:hypothetical protein
MGSICLLVFAQGVEFQVFRGLGVSDMEGTMIAYSVI